MVHEIRESTRAKYLRITVNPDGVVVLTKPAKVSLKRAQDFAARNEAWVLAALQKFRASVAKRKGTPATALPRPRKNSSAYNEARKAARLLVTERLIHFNELYGFPYGTISIRDQKTRWGSCSAKGNLSFNYRIVYLPVELQDYIIVHELCHTKEHNHSERFWAQVTRAIPAHALRRKELHTRYS